MSLSRLKRAVVLDPSGVEARFQLAEAFFQLGKLPEARRQLEKLLELDEGHANGRRLMARVVSQLERRPDTCDPELWWDAALAFAGAQRLDDAILFGTAACAREPAQHKRWGELAEWCVRRRLFERAGLAFAHALQLTQRQAQHLEARDRMLRQLGEDDTLDLFSEAPLGPLHDALRLLVEGDVTAAKKVLATAPRAARDTGFFHRVRAEVWASEGEDAKASQALAQGAQLDERPFRPGRLKKLLDWRLPGRLGVLGWTPVGGAVSLLEAVASRGDGRLRFTGNVGDSIRESCLVAHSALKQFDAQATLMDLHLHFTDIEATKEGFSAGLALTLAGLSALKKRPLFPRLATTGAITLHGEVQRIDGVYEKAVSARLCGVRRILYPRGNSADVKQLPRPVTDFIELIPVSSLAEALEHAF